MQLRPPRLRPRQAVAFAALGVLALAPASASARATDQPSPRQALERALQASRGELPGREVTLANRDLLLALDDLGPRDRARARQLMARPTDLGDRGATKLNYEGRVPTRRCSTKPNVEVHFCAHYLTDGSADAPSITDSSGPTGTESTGDGIPDYVNTMLREFDLVAARQNDGLGWPAPVSDGGAGGGNEFDIYIGNLGPKRIYGYAQYEEPTDPKGIHAPAFMVMDNDYAEFAYPDYHVPLQVTAAHEYNHVLQGAIDIYFDPWFGEATATWMEEQVYPAGDDWIFYLPGWSMVPHVPITAFTPDDTGPAGNKPYGSSVFLHWLSDRPSLGGPPSPGGPPTAGQDMIRDSWEAMPSTTPEDYAVAALDTGLAQHSHPTVSSTFGAFAAATAEWRIPNSGFHDREHYGTIVRPSPKPPGVDMTRTAPLSDGSARSDGIDHTGYRLYEVPANGTDAVRLNVTAPAGVASSIALVGRIGGIDTGTVTIQRKELPVGGKGSVILHGVGGFSRVTAVVANADTGVTGWDDNIGDWGDWTFAGDGRSYTTTATKDLSEPVEPGPVDPPRVDPPVVAPTPPAPVPVPDAPKLVAPSKATTLTALRGLGTALSRQLKTRGITKLRSTRPAFAFSAPSAGRLDVRIVVGGKTVSSVRANAAHAGRLKTRLRATSTGRRLLRSSTRKTATLVLRFAPKGAPAQELRRRITIRR